MHRNQSLPDSPKFEWHRLLETVKIVAKIIQDAKGRSEAGFSVAKLLLKSLTCKFLFSFRMGYSSRC